MGKALYAPNGVKITGLKQFRTFEAGIYNDDIERDAKGKYVFEFDGEDVDHDDERYYTLFGERVFIDEENDEWRESELVWKDEDSELDGDDVTAVQVIREKVASAIQNAEEMKAALEIGDSKRSKWQLVADDLHDAEESLNRVEEQA